MIEWRLEILVEFLKYITITYRYIKNDKLIRLDEEFDTLHLIYWNRQCKKYDESN